MLFLFLVSWLLMLMLLLHRFHQRQRAKRTRKRRTKKKRLERKKVENWWEQGWRLIYVWALSFGEGKRIMATHRVDYCTVLPVGACAAFPKEEFPSILFSFKLQQHTSGFSYPIVVQKFCFCTDSKWHGMNSQHRSIDVPACKTSRTMQDTKTATDSTCNCWGGEYQPTQQS